MLLTLATAFAGSVANSQTNVESLKLSVDQELKLGQYASATVRYFTSSESNNKLTGFTHAFFAPGDAGQWRDCIAIGNCTVGTTALTREYGSHVNMNEVTLRLLSLAVAYKMNWLTYLPKSRRYAESWGQIQIALQSIDRIQTSGNPMHFSQGHFHRTYLTAITRDNVKGTDRTVSETVRPGHENVQSSDDNALPYLNLLLLEGLALDASINLPDRNIIIPL